MDDKTIEAISEIDEIKREIKKGRIPEWIKEAWSMPIDKLKELKEEPTGNKDNLHKYSGLD